uniref:Uncharacterized protein n=1 Tax=Romanomermis culicivorax TaxID=13658 RepID=A0A915JJ54_ROMCU
MRELNNKIAYHHQTLLCRRRNHRGRRESFPGHHRPDHREIHLDRHRLDLKKTIVFIPPIHIIPNQKIFIYLFSSSGAALIMSTFIYHLI